MKYPLISEYIESIKNSEDNFNELTNLRPVYDEAGEIVMSSGNFAVVFKMKDGSSGKLYAVKCFLKEQEGRDIAYQQITDELEYASSNYLCSIKYLQKELFVDSTVSSDTEFPVLLMDWAEGVTLDKYVHQHISDKYALQLITYQFCRMAAWLMSQPFAHGDLKPDNILVTEDGALVLVDYDGMYVPAMQGQKARELGSPDYRHPLRTEDCFNEHIDDFPLTLIGMSLKAIALDSSLLQNNARSDSLLFSESDFQDIGECLMMKSLCALLNDAEFSKLYALFILAHSQQELSAMSFRLFLLNKVEKPIEEVLSTEATEEDFKYAIEDEYGVKYSRDGKKLLKASFSSWEEEYVVREGTEVICDGALQSTDIESVKLPSTIISIGSVAFADSNLVSCNIPASVKYIAHNNPWGGCGHIVNMDIQSKNFIKKDGILYSSDFRIVYGAIIYGKSVFNIDNRSKKICANAFSGRKSLQSITIPNSVKSIGDYAFSDCESLQSITIPNSVKSIGNKAFSSCKSLQSVTIPNSVTSIGDRAFSYCDSLQSVTIPNSVRNIGNHAFRGCNICFFICNSTYFQNDDVCLFNKDKTAIVSRIKDCVNYIIPNSVTNIGNGTFSSCESLQSITVPNSVTSIGDYAFNLCRHLDEPSRLRLKELYYTQN